MSPFFRSRLECLEDRFLPSSTELFGGLEFVGTFASNNNVITATTPVQVGVAPAKGASFNPLLQLNDGVQFNSNDSTGTFSTTSSVSVLTGGVSIPLLKSQAYTFTGPGLLSSNYFSLAGEDSNTAGLAVAGGNLAVSALHLSAQELDLQGNLTLSVLSGLNLGVSGSNHVAVTPGGVSLTGLNVTVAGPTNVTFEGLPISLQNLQVEYSSTNNEFEASGSASVTVAGNTLGLTLGSSSDPGLDVVNGSLQSLNATVNITSGDSDTPFEVAGVSFGLSSPTFDYNSTNQTFGIGADASFEADGQSVEVTLGTAGAPGIVIQGGQNGQNASLMSLNGSVTSNIELGDLTLTTKDLAVCWTVGGDVMITGDASLEVLGQSIDLALGAPDSSDMTQAGISFSPTTGQLDTLNAVLNSTITIGGVTIQAKDLGVQYSSDNPDLTISGSASFELQDDGGDTPSQSVELTLSDGSGTTGLIIDTSNNLLVSLDAAVTTDLSIGGLDIKADDLEIDYTSSAFTVLGTASVAWEGSTIQLSLAKNDGLVITNGQLTSLDATVTSDINLMGITLDVSGVTFDYMAASGNNPEQFELYGGSVSLQTGFLNFSTTLGSQQDPGLEIAGGRLENLNISVDGGFSLDGINVSANGVNIQYDPAAQELDLAGGVTLDLTSDFQISASIGGGGLLINPSTGSLSIGPNGVSIDGSATLGPFSVSADVAFSNGTNGINLSVSGNVDLPGGIDIGIEKFDIVNGQLADIGLSYSVTAPALGIPIADTGFYITALSGELDNLNNPSQVVVSASASITLGEQVNVPSISALGVKAGSYSLLEATGSITVSASELDLSGSVTLAGGFLGQGSASVDLNWGTGVYTVTGNFGIYDNIITFGGSLTIDNQGDITAEATASVNFPPQLPFIGGDSLGNINFALDYRANEPSSQSFIAAWTNVNLFVTSFTIGFEYDFAGDFSIIDGSQVQQLTSDVSAQTMQQLYTYTEPFSVSGAYVAGANVTVDSPTFEDYDYAASGNLTATINGTEGDGYQVYQFPQPDIILGTLQFQVYQQSPDATVLMGTGSFDQEGNFSYQTAPGFGYGVTSAYVSAAGSMTLVFGGLDPGTTFITASYEVTNGATLELLENTQYQGYQPVERIPIDPIATANYGSFSAVADGQSYTDTLTTQATQSDDEYVTNFPLSHGSPNPNSVVANVFMGSTPSSSTLLGQASFANGRLQFTPSSTAPFTPFSGIIDNGNADGTLSLDWSNDPGNITIVATYTSATDRVLNVNLQQDTDASDAIPGQYEIELIQPQPLNDATLSYNESLQYEPPTVSFSGTPKVDADGQLHYTLNAYAFTPQSQTAGDTSTTVSIYCSPIDGTTNGTLIDTLDFSAMNMVTQGNYNYARTANFTWGGFQDQKAGNYYFYAVISDGQSAPQFSAITGPVSSAGPVPILSAPSDLVLSPDVTGGVEGVFSAPIGSAPSTALGATINTTNPLTATVTVNGGGTLAVPGGSPATTLTETYTTVPTSILDGLIFTSNDTFGGGTTLTYTVSQGLVEVTNAGSGYQSAPTVTFTGADSKGSGMTGYAEIENGQVTGVLITAAGAGYDEPPEISFSGGSPTAPAAAKYLTYSASQTIPLVVANTHLLVTQTVSGTVSGVTVTNGGSGYQSTPAVTFTSADGSGSGAEGCATIRNGKVVSVTITDAGAGYDAPPRVTFSGGSPTTSATATAAIIVPPANPNNATVTITVTNPGGPDDQAGTDVQVQDYLTPGLTVLAANPSQGTFDPSKGVWNIGNLPVSISNTVTLTLTLEAAPGTTDTMLTSTADASSALPNFPAMDAESTLPVLPVANNIVITPATLPPAAENSPYQMALSANGGGGGPYTFTLAAGSLPTGVSLAASGLLSGTPTTGGTYTFSVTATGPTGISAAVPLQLSVANTSLALVGTVFDLSVPFVAGGNWSVSSGSLPPGLSLTVVNFYASVTGTPTTPGTYNFDIQEKRSGGQISATNSYTVVVDSTIIPSEAPLPAACIGCSCSVPLMATGGTGNYVVSLTSGALPEGLSISENTLCGTVAPTAAPGSYPFTLSFQDEVGQVVTQTYTLMVNAALTLTPTTLSSATIGSPYSQPITASGGSGIGYMYSITGTLPPGLTLSANGTLSGTIPAGTIAAPATFPVTVTDSTGSSFSQTYTLAVNPPVSINPATLPAGEASQPYSETLTATGGTGTGYTFTLQSGSLPPGLTLSSAGALAGTIESTDTSGYCPFSVLAKDSAGDTASLTDSFFVDACLGLSAVSLPAVQVSTPYQQQLTATGGSGIYAFSLAAGTLPAGLTLSTAGLVRGIVPVTTAAGNYNFTVAVTDSLGFTTSCTCSLTVTPLSETWTGAASTAWSNPANWSAKLVPAAAVNVVIPTKPSGGHFPTLSAAAGTYNLTIQAGATLTLAGQNLTVADGFTNQGTLVLEGNEVVNLATGNDAKEGTWEYVGDGTGRTLDPGISNYFNLVIADSHTHADTFQTTTSLTANGILTITCGTFTASGGMVSTAGISLSSTGVLSAPAQLNDSGNFVVTGGSFNADGGLVELTGSGPQQLASDGKIFFGIDHTGTGTLSLSGSGLTLNGGLTNAGGIFQTNNLGVTVDGPTMLSGGTLAAGKTSLTFKEGLTLDGGSLQGSSGTITAGGVTLEAGILNAPTTLVDTGNWTNTGGIFTAGTGTVDLTGTGQVISGNTTFHNLTKTVSTTDTLTFRAGSTQTIGGTLTLKGSSGHLLNLESSIPGMSWDLDPLGSDSVSFVNVQDSHNVAKSAITATNSHNSGDNSGWNFPG